MVNLSNNVTTENRFDSLHRFLKTKEEISNKLEQLGETENQKRSFKESSPQHIPQKKDGGCIVCGDQNHKEKLFFCKQFKK